MFATIAASSNSGNPLGSLLFLVPMIAIFYFVLIRPQQRRAKEQRALQNSVDVGDEVMTTGGIFGTVIDIDDDEGVVTVEISPGTRIRMVRAGIARRLTENDEEYDDEPEEEDQQFS